MKKIILFLMVLFTTVCYAQSDFDIAQSFMNKKGIKLVPNERFATRGTDAPYSIFNGSDGKGFCIVVNGNVVGYDVNNIINEDDIPCCLKELLETYSKVIPKGRTRGTDYYPLRETSPIEPLLTTHWSQSSPYNDLLEKKHDICTWVAWCQILHYFRVPQTLKDYVVNDSLTLPITYFDHDKILDKYNKNTKYENGEREEVAKLFYYYSTIEMYGVLEYFGIDSYPHDEFAEGWMENYNKKHDELLERGIPIWNCGRNHAYVIDGRDSEGRFHLNLGWGGQSDGYYTIPDNRDERSGSLDWAAGATQPYYFLPVTFNWAYTQTTGINSKVKHTNSDSTIYNLQGIKVGNSLDGLPKGIYIQNKKKYVIK